MKKLKIKNQKSKMRNPSWFKKGHRLLYSVPKGTRLSPRTEFKKGCRPGNYKPVGTVIFRSCKRWHLVYKFIKVRDDGPPQKRWIYYHIYLWQKSNGPVPAGKLISHKNGKTLDDRIENLVCVDRAGHLSAIRKRDPDIYKKISAKRSKTMAKKREQRQFIARFEKKIKNQQKLDKKHRKIAEKGLADLRGPLRHWWECIGCGQDYGSNPPHICPKCNGLKFSKITQRLKDVI